MAAEPEDNTPDPSIAKLIAARSHLHMHAMDGLVMEDVPLARIADAVGTPTWVYSAGIPASRIVYSGVGKSERELRLALTEDIGQINVESVEELRMLSAIAVSMGRIARVAPRVNPDVDAGTHEKISTGRARDKFGIPYTRRWPFTPRPPVCQGSTRWASPPISAARSWTWRLIELPSRGSPISSASYGALVTRCVTSIAVADWAFPTATSPDLGRRRWPGS